MFFKKKKTGADTPEYKKAIFPPKPEITPPMPEVELPEDDWTSRLPSLCSADEARKKADEAAAKQLKERKIQVYADLIALIERKIEDGKREIVFERAEMCDICYSVTSGINKALKLYSSRAEVSAILGSKGYCVTFYNDRTAEIMRISF